MAQAEYTFTISLDAPTDRRTQEQIAHAESRVRRPYVGESGPELFIPSIGRIMSREETGEWMPAARVWTVIKPIWVSPLRDTKPAIKRSPNCKPPILGITTTTPEGRYQSWRHE